MEFQRYIDTLVAIQSIYPSEFELISKHDSNQLQELLETSTTDILKLDVQFRLKLLANSDPCYPIDLDVVLPSLSNSESSHPMVSVGCPAWMTRKAHHELNSSLPTGPDCILEAIDYIQTHIPQNAEPNIREASFQEPKDTQLKRIWLYLISLSTRSKRNDMVTWAPAHNLTGFVMAGKPGVLCLEGTQTDYTRYLSLIKSESWADVPSYQKKISVVLEEDIETRLFENMIEITDLFTMGGVRHNRPEMSQVKGWFEKNGVGYAFSVVFDLP